MQTKLIIAVVLAAVVGLALAYGIFSLASGHTGMAATSVAKATSHAMLPDMVGGC
jgi:hypothetical protein